MLKSHNCGELTKKYIGEKVTLAGWVDRRRDHGGLIFIDLRDRSGIVQVVFNPEVSPEAHKVAGDLRGEYVVRASGEVSPRPKGTENPALPTGEVEVVAGSAQILNSARTPPFYISEESEVDESLRLKYRYLDLRRARMRDNLILRHRVVKYIRDFLDARGFIEVETPILIKSTPEGARDYLVPSRVHPHLFYALPQSPQQLKQLLMVAGLEKYFQIAKCFRDEDTRADRQPEFTQLDLEMSFVEREDILNLTEALFTTMVEALKPEIIFPKPFPRLTYAEAMASYGSDKPDLRFGLEIKDLSQAVQRCSFSVFRSALVEGGMVRGILAPGCAGYGRSLLYELNDVVKRQGAAGLLTIALGDSPGSLTALTMEKVRSIAAKYLSLDEVRQMAECLGAKMGDLLLIVAGKPELVSKALGELRLEMSRRLKLVKPNQFTFAFVLDFPLFERNKDTGRWQAVHHPFTSPVDEEIKLMDDAAAIEKIRAKAYDIVCNGYELGGGSLRIYNSELQKKVFRILGHSDAETESLFGHLLEAFGYGAPPHGGIAVGIDRTVMLLAGAETIREVIAFPKNQSAMDLTFGAPAEVSEAQLKELHLAFDDEK
ncbi:MAG: aspartate--tRNA ligase [Chloroflexota bacterium]